MAARTLEIAREKSPACEREQTSCLFVASGPRRARVRRFECRSVIVYRRIDTLPWQRERSEEHSFMKTARITAGAMVVVAALAVGMSLGDGVLAQGGGGRGGGRGRPRDRRHRRLLRPASRRCRSICSRPRTSISIGSTGSTSATRAATRRVSSPTCGRARIVRRIGATAISISRSTRSPAPIRTRPPRSTTRR